MSDYSFTKVFSDLYRNTDTIRIKILPAQEESSGTMTNIGIRPVDNISGIIDDIMFIIHGDIYLNDSKIDLIQLKDLTYDDLSRCRIRMGAQTICGSLIIDTKIGTFRFINLSVEEELTEKFYNINGYFSALVSRIPE